MLSTSQQAIIDNLTNEFNKSNTSIKSPLSDLFDVNAIINEHKEEERISLENKLNRESYELQLKEHMSLWATKLSELFLDLGLKATADVKGTTKKIIISKIKVGQYGSRSIFIKGTVAKRGGSNKVNGFRFDFIQSGTSHIDRPTLEEIISLNTFKVKIKNLYSY
jgi:predicted transcriptional regulator